MERQLHGLPHTPQQVASVSRPMEIPAGVAPEVSGDAGQSRASAAALGPLAAGQQGRMHGAYAAKGQQEQQQQGEVTSDGAARPPALDRVSIASAIGEQHPPLSRHGCPHWLLSHCLCTMASVCTEQGLDSEYAKRQYIVLVHRVV
jgi:hypothetical protein